MSTDTFEYYVKTCLVPEHDVTEAEALWPWYDLGTPLFVHPMGDTLKDWTIEEAAHAATWLRVFKAFKIQEGQPFNGRGRTGEDEFYDGGSPTDNGWPDRAWRNGPLISAVYAAWYAEALGDAEEHIKAIRRFYPHTRRYSRERLLMAKLPDYSRSLESTD